VERQKKISEKIQKSDYIDYKRITQIIDALKKEKILLIIPRNPCNQGSLIKILMVFQGPPKKLLTNGVKTIKI